MATTDNKNSNPPGSGVSERTRLIIEGIIDVAAIAGLVVLAAMKVVDASIVIPVISIIAGGSIGARLGGKAGGDGSGGGGGTPSSLLLLSFTPLLQAVGRAVNKSARVRVALVLGLALFLTACGGGSTQSNGPAIKRTLWTLLRGACAVVGALPEPGAEPDTSGGSSPAAPADGTR